MKVSIGGSQQMSALQAHENETIHLDVFLEKDKIKTFETQLRVVRSMSLAVFRQKFLIPLSLNKYFYFCTFSEFGKEISIEQEN